MCYCERCLGQTFKGRKGGLSWLMVPVHGLLAFQLCGKAETLWRKSMVEKPLSPKVEQQEGISTETRPELATSFISGLPRLHHLPISYLKFESVSGSAWLGQSPHGLVFSETQILLEVSLIISYMAVSPVKIHHQGMDRIHRVLERKKESLKDTKSLQVFQELPRTWNIDSQVEGSLPC